MEDYSSHFLKNKREVGLTQSSPCPGCGRACRTRAPSPWWTSWLQRAGSLAGFPRRSLEGRESNRCTLVFIPTRGGNRMTIGGSIPMVWMMAFWTMRSSLSFPRPEETLQAEFLRELSPSSKSTLIRRCLSSVLNTSSTVGPAVRQQTVIPDRDQRLVLHERLLTQRQSGWPRRKTVKPCSVKQSMKRKEHMLVKSPVQSQRYSCLNSFCHTPPHLRLWHSH